MFLEVKVGNFFFNIVRFVRRWDDSHHRGRFHFSTSKGLHSEDIARENLSIIHLLSMLWNMVRLLGRGYLN